MRRQSHLELHFTHNPTAFLDLPWEVPLNEWQIEELYQVDKGISSHPVCSVKLDKTYVLKEGPYHLASKEYKLLKKLREIDLPVVTPIGYVQIINEENSRSILITEYLEHGIPYRLLFMQPQIQANIQKFLDALAIMLVNLHLSGFFWGDCSLSNVLFRRDAGRLQAYLVDTETSRIFSPLPQAKRDQDLEIMSANISGELFELANAGELSIDRKLDTITTQIIDRYNQLWDLLTQPKFIDIDKKYQIQTLISKFNRLGFCVDRVEIDKTVSNRKLKVVPYISDRNYHRHKLHRIIGIEAEEFQAHKILNDISEFRQIVQTRQKRRVNLEFSAYYWYKERYEPTIQKLRNSLDQKLQELEIYCQVLEHKWYQSEEAEMDIGMDAAIDDFINKITISNLQTL